ncbi:MAG: rod shape-determining protein MreC [Candidatus Pacebacteria bacterium]|nr:rod shape-determining protein MreC [Candidatus Paceibacterota bacterium]
MRFRSNLSRMSSPMRFLMLRGVWIALVLLAVLLIYVSSGDRPLMVRSRELVTNIVTPVYDIVDWPIRTIGSLAESWQKFRRLRVEHDQLMLEVKRLETWEETARKLAVENRALRDLLNFVPEPNSSDLSARVIGDSGGIFVRNILIAAGQKNGVQKGQVVMAGNGLVGRVTEVGKSSARILLLTDLNSRIPVAIEGMQERAILVGDNSAQLGLLYLPADAPIKVGDRVVTSGQGGGFPPGLPIGVISAISERRVVVTSFVNLSKIDFVRVIDYGLNDFLPAPTSPIPPRGTKKS